MNKTALINIVGLTKRIIGEDTPFLREWSGTRNISSINPVLPAVTCSAQTTYLTGKWPGEHGIVGNGWLFRDEQELKLWRQSNKLVQSPSIWDNARNLDPSFTCANMFWWYNMYSSVDYGVTPRPQYRANGLKIPDCYSSPSDLRDRLQKELGTFPLFHFWGPKTTIKSSEWISEASKKVHQWHDPDLLLVYLPHLDYVLQKYGHETVHLRKDLLEIDRICKSLITFLENRNVTVDLISEYGITDVDRPIHINRILREKGLLAIRSENELEFLDAGASKAFALADHQIAHIYFNDVSHRESIKKELENTPGIEFVLDDSSKNDYHLDHERSGELIAVADQSSWFTYYYWLDDRKAPDFARTVDIHKKPGYDPVELFIDPKRKLVVPRIALKLLKKKLGFRTMMDFIPLDASLVKGSHGAINVADRDKPVFISANRQKPALDPTEIHDIVLKEVIP